ncbi:MAG: 3-phosphoshikimate 1-carboxyvinyltransferase [Rhodothermales bacterium]|jgi:3-phosphoshikimate 1-carboxyvinyltransferase
MSAPTDIQIVNPSKGLSGRVRIPGDKSIAHRCALFASLGQGSSRIVHFPRAADPHSTLACIRGLGVSVVEEDDGILVVEGRGLHGWQPPSLDLDCGNSGTTMRLIAGLLAGRTFDSRLIGDASLQSRPMGRIADPLRSMGALIELTGGRAPISIRGQKLQGLEYVLPVASAQVKSAVLLAGIFADGETVVIETEPSRDHTERMLGLNVLEIGGKRHISVEGDHQIPARTWAVPGDFSAAAFFLVAGSVIPNSFLKIPGAGMNPTRTGLIQVLRAMGADITVSNERVLGGEPIADLAVRSAHLTGVTVGGSIVPNLIDEIPVLAVAAALADGETVIRDAAELRVKETDRIAAMGTGLRAMGAHVVETADGMTIRGGGGLTGAHVEAFHDHRIAMALAVAGLAARGQTTIHGASAAAVSFPDFWDQLNSVSWS